MRKILQLTTLSVILGINGIVGIFVATAQEPLTIVYPPEDHQTTSDRIFVIGTAAPSGNVTINGQAIKRSQQGHFAPSFPLQLGKNQLIIRDGDQEIRRTVTRLATTPSIPQGVAFASEEFSPKQDIARLPGEWVCFSAVAPPQGQVFVELNHQIIPLLPQSTTVQLPSNAALLTGQNQPQTVSTGIYEGCATFTQVGLLGNPVFNLSLNNQTIQQKSPNTVEILSPNQLKIIEVIADQGVARTGAGTDYSRLTPLPKGTKAMVTAIEGEWLRLDYGGWINQQETQTLQQTIPPKSVIRSIAYKPQNQATQIIFPLQTPVPIRIHQEDDKFILSLYNTTAQTDTIRLDDDSLIQRLDWQQVNPQQIDYTFHLKTKQQWGYDVRYEGTNLVLTLRHPPKANLDNITILIDPGHGGEESGSKGPTGYPEKDVNLIVSRLLKQELIKRGINVYLTRESDQTVSLGERVKMINDLNPTLALSIHYNALPDNGNAENTAGISTFWYHSQAHQLAIFLHNYLVEELNRSSYGVYWNNLALTRPHTAPSVLLELGFLINPTEFEWITNSHEQKKLAKTLADGIVKWLENQKR